MKYAFVIGSNAFIVPSRVVNYDNNGEEKQFLRVNSIFHNLPADAEKAVLDIDLNIKDTDGTSIVLVDNKTATYSSHVINTDVNSIEILKADGSTVIKVHQLFDEDAMSLEHNIAAELEVNAPIVAIRITGEFMLDDLHIRAENEKLFVNDTGYATSAMTGSNQLLFSSEGVVI